jgi:hypothetical protein
VTAPELPLEIQGDLAAAFYVDAPLPQTAEEVRQTVYGAIAALTGTDTPETAIKTALDGLYWFATEDFARAAEQTGARDEDTAFDAFCDRMIAEATQ